MVTNGSNIRKALSKNVVDVAQSLVSLEVAGDIITDNLTTLTEVGLGNILKVVLAAQSYVVFADDSGSSIVADVNASPALDLPTGTHYVLCTGDFIRMSVNPTRKELIRT